MITQRHDIHVLGADPGFASFGYCMLELTTTGERPIETGVLRTAKDNRKRNTLVADDNHRRCQELFGALQSVLNERHVILVCSESPSLPRNASVSHKQGIAYGVLGTTLAVDNIPLSQASPQRIKKILCGEQTASKEDVQRALEERYPGAFDRFKAEYPRGQWEHGFDAAAALVACLGSDVVTLARRLQGGNL